jgi:HEPN domain-containing protein
MKPITGEWITKAEGDFATAQRELKAIDHPNYDAVCFHAQQCAEKYLKAFLQEANIAFPKTHDPPIYSPR